MALVVVLVFGITTAAIAGFGAVSFRHTRITRTQTHLRASAVRSRYQLEQLVLGRPCMNSSQLPIDVNDARISINCGYRAGSDPGADAWAAIITGEEVGSTPLIRTQSPMSTASGSMAPSISVHRTPVCFYRFPCRSWTVTCGITTRLTVPVSSPRCGTTQSSKSFHRRHERGSAPQHRGRTSPRSRHCLRIPRTGPRIRAVHKLATALSFSRESTGHHPGGAGPASRTTL